MINLKLGSILLSWVESILEITFFGIEYAVNGYFRTDYLFAFGYYDGEVFLELFFFVLIGNKEHE